MNLSRSLILTLLLLAAGLSCTKEAPPGHFTATMIEQDGTEQRASKLYVADDRYRVEIVQASGQITLIVNKGSQEAYIISEGEQEYTKVTLENQQLVNRDPFLAIDFLKQRGEISGGGNESFNGFACTKETLSFDGQPMLTQWIADDLHFPIKIENHRNANKYIELDDIKREEVPEALFAIPEGYKELAGRPASKVPRPDWVNDLPKAMVIETPFERSFAAGDIIRIPTRPETSIWIKAEPLRDEADVRAIPFVNGSPLQPVEAYPNIADPGVVCSRSSETTREATEIVVRVFSGVVRITAKGVATMQKALQSGKVGILRIRPELRLEEFRLVNSTAEPAIVSWDFYQDDMPLIEGEHPVPVSGRINLAPYEVKRSSIDVAGNRLHIRSEQGDVLVSLGQWDPNKF